MSTIRRWMLYGVVLGFVLFGVTACGGGGGQQTQQPASQPSPPPTEQPAQPPAAPAQSEEEQLIARGQSLASSIGCTACHSADGTTLVGPTWKGLYGHEVEVVLPDGTETKVVADEAYLRESILDPNAKITKGFQANLMPIYQGQLSEDDIKAIIAYIKSLQGEHSHE
ncbi:Cytochrome c2 [bacterium HR07]|uniref:Cytochrome c class I n=1 Tax=Acetithermum autotrophicum TaxID=1446466 RepID=H5SRN6_ACEAU|nr:cytochrome c class I [Candidatus Acetothermum autotrophicum]GBC76040.1 Cytochrome c2 [bacterium HR07]